jgi:hypothetical protein
VNDTPKTDAAAIRCACSTYVVPSEFARELERENAALRADKERLVTTLDIALGGLCVAALRDGTADLIQDTLDVTRKEAGDDAIMRQHLNEGGTPT